MTTAPPNLVPQETPATSQPPGSKFHVLVTGASSGLGRAFFEHFSSFPPTTHYVRGIDARPYPTHPTISSCTVGSCGHFSQLDLTAEALVQKFVRSATLATPASPGRSRSSSHAASPASPTISYHSRQRLTSVHHAHATSPPHSSPTRPPADLGANPYAAPFDLVVHSAGIRGLVPSYESHHPGDVSGAETIAIMDAATMRRTYEINTVATFTLIKALLPSLRTSSELHGHPPRVVTMASRMGSLERNVSGGAYAYRASKAALNAVVRSFSIDVPEVTFALVHPGRVETGLVRTREEGAVDVGESVADILKLIERLGDEGEHGLKSGCFVDRWGKEIPW